MQVDPGEVCRQGMPPGVVTPIEANLLCSCVEKVSEGSSSFSTRPEAEVEISIMLKVTTGGQT